jgi:hypothetical protein
MAIQICQQNGAASVICALMQALAKKKEKEFGLSCKA